MKIPIICLSALLSACGALAQKALLPKDLPSYGPERPLASPAVKLVKLDNGLTVWLVPKPGFPKIALALSVRGGFAADPVNLPGISKLLASTVDQGTSTRSARQIAQDLQGAGGDLRINPGKDSISVSTSFLSSKTDDALSVFADVIRNASFPDDEVTLAKRNAIDQLKQQESQPAFLAARAIAKELFGDNPYHVTAPTLESITASTPADLRRIYAERFRPDQALLVAVGDFENDRMLAEIRNRFDAWKAPAEAPARAPATFSAVPRHADIVVPRPGSVQTTLRM